MKCGVCRKNVPTDQACNSDEGMLSICKLNPNNGGLLHHQPVHLPETKVTPLRLVRDTNFTDVFTDVMGAAAFAAQK